LDVFIQPLPPRGFGEGVECGKEGLCEVDEVWEGRDEDLEREGEDAEAGCVGCSGVRNGLTLEQGFNVYWGEI
jgi:hypothetical protein